MTFRRLKKVIWRMQALPVGLCDILEVTLQNMHCHYQRNSMGTVKLKITGSCICVLLLGVVHGQWFSFLFLLWGGGVVGGRMWGRGNQEETSLTFFLLRCVL